MHVVLALAMLPGALGAQVLPPPPVDTDPARQLSAQARLFVKGYRFEGNAAFSDAELAKLTEPYSQRELGTDELEQARRDITLHYVRNGYINSGAVIPDQNPADGIILIRIVEGELTEIELHGNKWLRDGYIRSRLERWSRPPLNLTELQEGLQLLRQNPNVRQINGELKPGSSPGQSILDVKVEDQQPFRVGLQFDNQRPPSVGAEQISLLAADMNLTGNSDPLQFRYGIANASAEGLEFSGVDNLDGSYSLPLNRFDTSIGLHGSRLNTSIVEDPLLPLAITSLTKSFGLVLRQPVYQRPNEEIAVSIGFDRSDNQSWLLDEPFNVSPGAVDGQMVVSVLRLSQEWLRRGPNHVLALRSTFNLGLDVWDATDNGVPGDPDAEFFSWLGQAQYVQRLFKTQNQVILRLTGQWALSVCWRWSKSAWAATTPCAAILRTRWCAIVVSFRRSNSGCLSCSTSREPGCFTWRLSSISAGGGITTIHPARPPSAARAWGCYSRRASISPRRFTGGIGCETSIFPTTQACKSMEWVSRSTCRRFRSF